MNTDNADRMEQDGAKLQYAKDTEQIIGAAMEVMNILGHGLLEKPYENALCVELKLRGIPLIQQPQFDVMYKSIAVGFYVPDIIVKNRIVVDAKTIDRITDHELGQMLNYLSITGHPVGLILNFKRPRLEWKRVVR